MPASLKALSRSTGIALICLLTACNSHGEQATQGYNTPAHFKVTTEIVNTNLQPFTATIGGFGNSLVNQGSGFEPVVYRNKFIALEDSPDRVVADPSAISHWDTLREGVLDGADVQVYRVENGRFDLVREDRIPLGGYHASGWLAQTKSNMVVPPDGSSFIFRWDTWNRPGVDYYFTVRAVDYRGNLSDPAKPFSIRRPATLAKSDDATAQVAFTPSKTSSDNFSPPAPANLRGHIGANGILVLEWDPVEASDLAGYIVYRSDYPPEDQKGYYIQLSAPATPAQQIRAGDVVIVSKKFYSASRNRYHTNRVWGATNENQKFMLGLVSFYPDENPGKNWELVPHAADTPVEEPGETCLRLELAAGEKEALLIYNHSGTGQDWYDVLEKEPYKAEVWLRQEGGSGRVRFNIVGFYGERGHGFYPTDFSVGSNWKKYETIFTPSVIYDGKTPNQMRLEFTGPGTFYVDNFRVYRADTGFLDLLPRDYDQIRSSGMMALRTHGTIKTGTRTYDLDQFTNPGGVISGTVKLNTLPQTLAMMHKAGVRPWLQVEPHMTPREWRAFVEYMAAPYDPSSDTPQAKPWAYKRYQQGQAKPWVDEFDKIYFELGNETWNGLFRPWVFDGMTDAVTGKRYTSGQVYGMYQEFVRSSMRSSPYWSPARLDDKIIFMLGGWNGQNYGRDAASSSPSSKYMTIAAYNGGWDEAEGPPGLNAPSFFNVLNQVSQSAIPSAERHLKEVQDINAQRQSDLRLGTYEAGPGYALNGLNNAKVSEQQAAEQEQVMKSQAAGTATLDSFLARAYLGFDVQNFFTYSSGAYWTSHAKWYQGGQEYPSWKLLELFNKQATGDMLRTETVSVPVVDLKAFNRRNAVKDAPLTAVYATRTGSRVNVFVISRKMPGYPQTGDDGFTPATVDLPFRRAASVTLYRMAAAPEANNTLADDVRIEQVKLPASVLDHRFAINSRTGGDHKGLPPAATFLYVFEGVAGLH